MKKAYAIGAAMLVAGLAWTACRKSTQELELAADVQPSAIYLHEMDIDSIEQEWGKPHAGQSVDGNPLRVAGKEYVHGVGTHALSEIIIDLHQNAARFTGKAGVDDEATKAASVRVEVWVDNELRANSETLRLGDEPFEVDVDLRGAKQLALIIDDGGNNNRYDHADWVDAKFELISGSKPGPEIMRLKGETPEIAMGDGPQPAIHGPRVTGTTPGRPFLFRIPATGEKPLRFDARNLPDGLALDRETGFITGSVRGAGEYDAELIVENGRGRNQRALRIVAGAHKLAQTPPMGWNSWNIWGCAVNDERVRAAADGMVASGLADKGYQYIVIDDCWEGERDANGVLPSNEKFPDMKALGDYIHGHGLKFGIYSSPGPTTCQGLAGSYQHELQDARTWADWGVDYLKYDWCGYRQITPWSAPLDELQKPYHLMREKLDMVDRDIVYSLCQYGVSDVWTWGESAGGNLWRTTGDIYDSWTSMSGIGFSQAGKEQYAGPGHWNDPDMLVVGVLGWSEKTRQSKLRPQEQVAHITLWSMLAAPMMIGCDMQMLDEFTVAVLGNTEVIDVNQDPLGKQGWPASRSENGRHEVWVKPLQDGTKAVGLFNRGFFESNVTVEWQAIGINGAQSVRDLWKRKNLGKYNGSFSARIPPHGAVMIRVGGNGDAS